jgi:hypothetical protein
MEYWILPLGLFALIGLAVAAAALSARKRREALATLAQKEGWHFVPDGREYAAALAHFPLFGKGHRRRAANVLHGGEAENEFWLFDYRYTVGHGKNSHTYHQTVVAFPHLPANLPLFELRPENLFHKLGAMFGYQDIDLPEHSSFSSRFLLRGKDASAIRGLFDPDLVRALESEKPRCIEGGGSALIVYRRREKANTEKIIAALDHARTIRDAFVNRAQRGNKTHSIPTTRSLPV